MDSINHYYFKRVEDRRAVIHRILQEIILFSIIIIWFYKISQKVYSQMWNMVIKEHQNWTNEVGREEHTSSSRRSEVMFRVKIDHSEPYFGDKNFIVVVRSKFRPVLLSHNEQKWSIFVSKFYIICQIFAKNTPNLHFSSYSWLEKRRDNAA